MLKVVRSANRLGRDAKPRALSRIPTAHRGHAPTHRRDDLPYRPRPLRLVFASVKGMEHEKLSPVHPSEMGESTTKKNAPFPLRRLWASSGLNTSTSSFRLQAKASMITRWWLHLKNKVLTNGWIRHIMFHRVAMYPFDSGAVPCCSFRLQCKCRCPSLYGLRALYIPRVGECMDSGSFESFDT